MTKKKEFKVTGNEVVKPVEFDKVVGASAPVEPVKFDEVKGVAPVGIVGTPVPTGNPSVPGEFYNHKKLMDSVIEDGKEDVRKRNEMAEKLMDDNKSIQEENSELKEQNEVLAKEVDNLFAENESLKKTIEELKSSTPTVRKHILRHE